MGWDLSTEKLVPYSECCKVLGVELSLYKTPSGVFEVCNTQSRVEELIQTLSAVISAGILTKTDGEKLRGRLQFASNQLFGRRLKNCLQELNMHLARNFRVVGESLESAMKVIIHLFAQNSPRVVSTRYEEWSHLYVDASFEPGGYSGIGGVLLDSNGTCVGCFSEAVDAQLLSSIMRPDQKTPIMELEALAIMVGLKLFAEKVKCSKLVVFTDNLSAQASLIKCRSNNAHVDLIIRGICTIEERLSMMCWLERVPSYSNPADTLSREEVVAYQGTERSRMNLLEAWNECQNESSPSLLCGGRRETIE